MQGLVIVLLFPGSVGGFVTRVEIVIGVELNGMDRILVPRIASLLVVQSRDTVTLRL